MLTYLRGLVALAVISGLQRKKPRAGGALQLVYLNGSPRDRAQGDRLCVDDANKLALFRAFAFKFYESVFLGEQRVIATQSDINARVETRAALANNDVARNDFLAAENLDA
jgi:hypothetical protein